jgi:hypothetical protein
MTRHVSVGLILIAIAGCGKGGIPRAAVDGQVTLDGVPIANGSIFFRPTGNTKGMSAGGAITDGRYQLSAAEGPVVGTNLVEIHCDRRTGRKVPVIVGDPREGMKDEVVEGVPERYNMQSKLTCEIQPGGSSHDFKLTTK